MVKLDRNYGFAEGYNRAIAATDYRYTVLLNSDVAPATGWLNPLYDYMEAHPDVGACQPKIRSYADHKSFEYAGACGGFLDRNGYPYCRGRIFDTVERDSGQYDMVIPVFWASGAALMVRSELYVKVGGLDKDFFAHMEEIDLCWRIKLAGYAVVVIPQSVVFHLGGGTLPPSNPRKTYLNFRNNLLLLHKNLPDSSRKKRLLVRRLYDALAWVKFVVSLDFADASAVLRAHRDFRKMRANYTSHPDVDLLPKSPDIVVDYYLRRRKVYSDLD
ncbi:glycosyltransferase [uncultured Muribaculum sp.]|uniref:glycosyltransferase n=1 Tax=uncultured Muribaculum sp. TaxID=1918613 RepID=UPI00351FA276